MQATRRDDAAQLWDRERQIHDVQHAAADDGVDAAVRESGGLASASRNWRVSPTPASIASCSGFSVGAGDRSIPTDG